MESGMTKCTLKSYWCFAVSSLTEADRSVVHHVATGVCEVILAYCNIRLILCNIEHTHVRIRYTYHVESVENGSSQTPVAT
jgi:hypothetical protein